MPDPRESDSGGRPLSGLMDAEGLSACWDAIETAKGTSPSISTAGWRVRRCGRGPDPLAGGQLLAGRTGGTGSIAI